MKRFPLAFTSLLFLLLAASPVYATGVDTWMSVRSRNFFLVGKASESELREVALSLEQFRDAFTRIFADVNFKEPVQTVVVVFQNESAYKPFKPLYQGRPTDVSGYFQPSTDLNYITLSIERSGANSYRTIFHEYVHLFVENNLRGGPLSFNEGLAEYYSTVEITDGGRKVTLGKPNESHARLLREGHWLPLETLFKADHHSAYYNERHQQTLFYAQSWALIHYLMTASDSQQLLQLRQFLELLAEGVPLADSFQRAFQRDLAHFEEALKRYVRRGRYPSKSIKLPANSNFNQQTQSASLSPAEAQYYLGDLHLHTNRLDEAEALLREALELDPKLAGAHASLGLLRTRQKRFVEAKQFLTDSLKLNSESYLANYYYAYTLSREGMNAELAVNGYMPVDAAAMRALLKKTIELAPDFAEAYRLLAFVNLATNEQLDEAVALIKQALALSPGNRGCTLVLAQIHLRRHQFALARQVLDELLQRSSDPQLRAQARTMLETVADTEKQLSAEALSRVGAGATSGAPPGTSNAPAADETIEQRKPKLAKRFSGERVRGLLTRVDCTDEGVILFVKAGERTFRLRNDELRRITFVAYVPGLGRAISCGQRTPANLVVLTYLPSSRAHATFDGEAVAVEFVPEDLEVEP
jgi:tetratricopeptide (TPR) repeat protein